MNQAGLATIAIGVAFLAVAGGTVGTSIAVDQLDQQPDSSIYTLEKAGEIIKKPLVDEQTWEIRRGKERTEEFQYMINKGKAQEYSPLLSEAKNHFAEAAKLSEDNQDLNKAMNAMKKHLTVLENLENEVPKEARPAIILAREQSSRCLKVLENISQGTSFQISEDVRESLQNRITDIKENIAKEQKQVLEKIKNATNKKDTIAGIIKNIENRIKNLDKEKPEEERINVAGMLEELQFTTWMYGTHAILEENQPIYALKSKKINLNNYTEEKVEIKGLKIHSGLDGGPPLVRVTEISILGENSDKDKSKQGENGENETDFVPAKGERVF